VKTVLALGLSAFGWLGLGASANAFEFDGSWSTASSACSQVFEKRDGAVSFRRDSDQYGGGFIVEGNRIRGQMQSCTITRRKEDGNIVHVVAHCADDIMTSNVQFSAKILDENTIARVFPGMPEFALSYSRCPK
jgi:hypothetical protein